MRQGVSAESKFEKVMRYNGFDCIAANPEANKCLHIDYIIKTNNKRYSVDVKSRKYRFDKLGWVLVEFTGKYNSKGWLYGFADFIAFELTDESFLFIKREKLKEISQKLIKDEYVNKVEDSLYKKCKRIDGDIYGHIKLDDISPNNYIIIKEK